MLDFVDIRVEEHSTKKKTQVLFYPDFKIGQSNDLMIRGKSFYAVWNERSGFWSRDELTVSNLVDQELHEAQRVYLKENPNTQVKAKQMSDFGSRSWTSWQNYAKSLPDHYVELDSKIAFSNTEVKKEDYITKRLPYALCEGDTKAYDELMSTLYEPSERDKLEWAIGAIISGDSKKIQKFIVLYGEAGSGKSTVLNIIQELFDGYYSVFEAKALAASSNAFALEAFKTNPLIAIQHDGDLSRIEDNTKLNSIVSHETMIVNEKFKAQYSMKFNSFLFMGTNKPVKITEAKSGIIRRLIDVTPSGRKIPFRRYQALMHQIEFELGAIADKCLKKYQKMGDSYYDKYKPFGMISATNHFYDFVEENYDLLSDNEGITLSAAWAAYKKYCTESNITYPYQRYTFKEELKNYFNEFKERDGNRYKVYSGFKTEKFDYIFLDQKEKEEEEDQKGRYSLTLESEKSLFDEEYALCPAQYAKGDESPDSAWINLKSTLSDIDTKKLHYVLVPENLIVIDFDLRDKDGNKDPASNLEAASKFPPTYAEYSKSGGGIHLHYIYEGDPLELERIYAPGIEIKVFKKKDGSRGYSSLRRKLSKCNDIPIATINSGLPKKGANDVVNFEAVKSEAALRTLIEKNLRKEYHPATKPSVDFIFKILDDAYKGDLSYDVSDLKPKVYSFAIRSSNNAKYCTDLVSKMRFKSEEPSGDISNRVYEEAPIVFFDIESFINLFVICWKFRGSPEESTVRMINPTPDDVKELFSFRLVGFNNRRYDNHMLYAAALGYSVKQLYELSQEIVSGGKNDGGKMRTCFFSEAYNLSYTDIYDFASKKQSLKKWEIELGIHHQELGLPWDQPAPEDLWGKVAEYCVNDVIATEAVFENRHADFTTRKLLADLSGLTVNTPNRLHITKILVGDEKEPDHVYTDLATGKQISNGPIPDDNGLINSFPGYQMIWDEKHKPHNMYRGTDVGFGGYVYAEHGMYKNVALLDVGNMHGASILALNKFGVHTKNYEEIRSARMAIKAGDFEKAKGMLNGKLVSAISEIEKLPPGSEERLTAGDQLQGALKLILNSTYGIAAATFKNPLRDPRDKNNIIALRGALFMRTLQDEVTARGFRVVHIKTDSIKIPDATPQIIDFVIDFGRKYGYEFEHEATYEKMCLVNNAVYIAKYDSKGIRNKGGKKAGYWTATGAQFAQPYVFKTLFSGEKIEFSDLCETKETSKGFGLYLDFNENLPEGEHDYRYIGRVGQFCPIKSGFGGGELVRELNGKYYAVTGTKKEKITKGSGEEPIYRWLESEVVKNANLEDRIDLSYYNKLVDDAISDISEFGDIEWFRSDDPVTPPPNEDFMNIPEDAEEELPF